VSSSFSAVYKLIALASALSFIYLVQYASDIVDDPSSSFTDGDAILRDNDLTLDVVTSLTQAQTPTTKQQQQQEQTIIKTSVQILKPQSDKHVKQWEGTLSCEEDYGGPSDEVATREMVYWYDIPADAVFAGPYGDDDDEEEKEKKEEQYLLFELDGGGWNNRRMSMETVFSLAHAMGRTLVLPPNSWFYIMSDPGGRMKKNRFGYRDFFQLESLAGEAGIRIISMKEYLQRTALTGQLKHVETGEVLYPPQNITNWANKDTNQLN